jgi:hypothetical protein
MVYGLEASLKLFDADHFDDVIERAATAAIAVIRGAIEERVPVRRGTLKDALSTQITPAVEGRVTAETGFWGPEADIALWQEYGWLLETHSENPIHRVPPRPFMRPAFDASKDAAIEAFADVLEKNNG